MKKFRIILIFTFIAVLGFLFLALPLSVSAQTNNNPKIRKYYFGQEESYIGPGDYYFDFSYIDEYYDYFIFVFEDNFDRNIYQYDNDVDNLLYEVNTGSGFLIEYRGALKFKIPFFNDFENYDNYIIALNYNFIMNINDIYINAYDEGYDIGYGKGYDDGLDDGYVTGYDYGYDEGYGDGSQEAFDEGYAQARDEFGAYIDDKWQGYNDGYDYGYDEGYWRGFNDSDSYNFSSILSQVFVGLGSFLSIQLLPHITIGAILAVPLVFGIISFIIGKRGGKDD